MTKFEASNNSSLSCIFVDDASYSASNWTVIDAASTFVEDEAGCSALLNTLIPDPNFEQALIDLGHDTGTIDGMVPTANIENITRLEVNFKNISDLTGIEDFASLKELYCVYNKLTALDISGNAALEGLNCGSNTISSLDLSNNNLLLKFLDFTDNQISTLDVSMLTNLESLFCSVNQLSALDVSQNPSLLSLTYASNSFTAAVDVTNNPVLEYYYCDGNNLSSIDVSQNPELKGLTCSSNNLTSIDISTNTKLEELNIRSNGIMTIDLSSHSSLSSLYCDDNEFSSLDLSKNGALINLTCKNNQLTSLDLRNGNNSAITIFESDGNPSLTCIFVDDANYSTTNWTNLDAASTFVEDEAGCMALSDENFAFTTFNMYPNPVKNHINISSNLPLTKIEVYSVLGTKVFETFENKQTLNVSHLNSGVYILKASAESAEKTAKFIIE